MRPLETSLFRLYPSRIFSGHREENEFPVIGDFLNHQFLEITKVEFWAFQKTENGISAICHLNCRFFDLKKVTFSVGQEAKNDFKVTFDNLNHLFFEFIKLHFQIGQRPKIS